MGACYSAQISPVGDTSSINRFLKSEFEKEKQTIKILFLGTGNSGKSTFMKQFKFISGVAGNSMLEKPIISHNITKSLQVLASACLDNDLLQLQGVDPEPPLSSLFMAAYRMLLANKSSQLWDEVTSYPSDISLALHGVNARACPSPDTLEGSNPVGVIQDHSSRSHKWTEEEIEIIKTWKTTDMIIEALWNEPLLKKVIEQHMMFDVEANVPYYMDSFKRIRNKDYVPTTEDILRIRQRTTGINTATIVVDKIQMKLIDVGGQRNERKKWISQFDNVTIILFLVSIGDYNLYMMEDKRKLRIEDSIDVFKYIVECPYFQNTDLLLFLNKADIFKEKIKSIPLKDYLKEYDGPDGYHESMRYLKKLFINVFKRAVAARIEGSAAKSSTQSLTIHETVATNPENASRIFDCVKETVQKANLKDANILS